MFFFNPGCPCCQQSDEPDISPSGGGWECGQCSSVPVTYRLTVPDTSEASLTVSVLGFAPHPNGGGNGDISINFNKEIENIPSYGGIHTLRRARSNTRSYPTPPLPSQSPPFIDDDGYFVFPYNRTTNVTGGNRGNRIYRDIRPCSWFGEYTDHNYSVEVDVGAGPVFTNALGVDHFWRLRMDYGSGVVRVEGPSSFTDWPRTLLTDTDALSYHQGRIGVVYQVAAADFQCNGTTILPLVDNNPRAVGWPPTVRVDADTILT